jgi:hypothetical protein
MLVALFGETVAGCSERRRTTPGCNVPSVSQTVFCFVTRCDNKKQGISLFRKSSELGQDTFRPVGHTYAMQQYEPRVHNLLFPILHPYGAPNAEALAHDLLVRVMEIPGVKSASLDLDAGHILIGVDPAHTVVQDVILRVLNETKGAQRG